MVSWFGVITIDKYLLSIVMDLAAQNR